MIAREASVYSPYDYRVQHQRQPNGRIQVYGHSRGPVNVGQRADQAQVAYHSDDFVNQRQINDQSSGLVPQSDARQQHYGCNQGHHHRPSRQVGAVCTFDHARSKSWTTI